MTISRVLVTSHKFLPDYAGWLQQTLAMIQACDPEQLAFTWISPYINGQPRVEELGYLTVHRIGDQPRGAAKLGRVAFGIDVVKYLYMHQNTYDLVYCPLSYMPTEIVSVTAHLLKKPVVVRVAQGELSVKHVGGRIRRWLLPRIADGLVVLNQGHALDRHNVYWHPNGVDTVRFHPPTVNERLAARQHWQFTNDEKVILFVGLIVARKGVDTLLSAFCRVQEAHPNAVLCLAGPLDEREGADAIHAGFIERLRAKIQEQQLTNLVRFTGRVSDVLSLMQAADIFVLPSLAEGMPNVLLEAMATGLPCVATEIPGIKDVIEDNVNGLLFAPGDVTALAEKLNCILKDPEGSQHLGYMARIVTETQLSIVMTAKKYQDLFLKATAK